MDRDTVEQVIRKFGSQQRVAEVLGIWQTAVSGWVRRGAIPARRQAELLRAARSEGIDLSPADFFGGGTYGGEDGSAALAMGEPVRTSPAAPPVARSAEIVPLAAARSPARPPEAPAIARSKELYAVGEIPPLGHLPKSMYAWAIRRERHGPPQSAMQQEIVPTPEPDSNEVVVLVMAAGVNYNGVWAALGKPISPFDVHKADYHIAGSDASGVVWAVGSKVKRWQVGDEVVIHCNQDDGDDEECNGGDPMNSPSQRIWGYETPDGSFAQFTAVQSRQLMPRPRHLTWEESGCYVLTLATAYRMLFGHAPHTLKPGQNVLVWGASGGLGSMAIQVIAASGANAIGVISDEDKRDFVQSLGARGVLNRRDFDCWGQLPDVDDAAGYAAYMKTVRPFGKAIWEITGKGNDVDIVFEHPGEATFPVSAFVVKRGGMVVICAGTTGYNLTVDARFLWMRQKRLQGSHFANLKQASAANAMVVGRKVDPCMSEVFSWADIPRAHAKMQNNAHKPGNMAVLVSSPRPGLRTLDQAMDG
ncbi:crotonyl-CoA carboxylase/reductase [Marinivivus vitaminiproducens]|uniref:crotonyl-CoA carboxylase/reductase n=1 Tax=Marinivivus vitaminiproducens TaxID=3035935 RepID=UPI0027A36AA8|nr:crotonyl-CoA carboxylase/reductase [Geminicoccaceae bacterium SCSIO 64248]